MNFTIASFLTLHGKAIIITEAKIETQKELYNERSCGDEAKI